MTQETASNQTLTSSSPQHIRAWLSKNHTKQLSLLDKFELEYLNNTKLTTPSSNNRIMTTLRTVEFLRSMIGSTKWKTGGQLLLFVKGLGKELHEAGAYREPAIGNAVRRIMCAIRDEVMMSSASTPQSIQEEKPVEQIHHLSSSSSSTLLQSQTQYRHTLTSMLYAHPQYLSNLNTSNSNSRLRSDSLDAHNMTAPPLSTASKSSEYKNLPAPFHTAPKPHLKSSIMEVLQEILSDLEDTQKLINDQTNQQIFQGDVILTYGHSSTIDAFLEHAAHDTSFHVIRVAASTSSSSILQTYNYPVSIIQETAIYTVMSRVTKVFLPAHALLANGGLVTHSGSNLVALCARHHSVPVICLTGMFKLCPLYPHEGQDTLQVLTSPNKILDYNDWRRYECVQVMNPMYDTINPELIHLYVTNVGGVKPSYIYRLLSEYYHQDDWVSFDDF